MTETKVPSSPRRRAFFIGALVLVVVALVATLAATWWIPAYRVSAARAAWQPPPDAVLSASMRERPVPGWRADPADSGLPRAPGSRFAVSDVPFGPRPFVGSIGSDAYFLALSGSDGEPQWWLIGVDVRSGQKLFDAVSLDSSASPPKCFLNGPNDVLCLSDDAPAASAWIIDRHSGMTRYQGPTICDSAMGRWLWSRWVSTLSLTPKMWAPSGSAPKPRQPGSFLGTAGWRSNPRRLSGADRRR